MPGFVKRTFHFTLAICCLSVLSAAAQNIYAGIGVGYALSISSQNLSSKTDQGVAETSNMNVRGSLGKGLAEGVYVGFKRSEHISIELNGSYLRSYTYKGHYNSELYFTEFSELSASMFRLTPLLKLSVGLKKCNLYMKLGPAFRVAGKIIVKNSHYDIPSNKTTALVWRYSGGFSMGCAAAIGVVKQVKKGFSVFAECSMINQSWGPKKGKMIKYEVDGVDQLSNLTQRQKETNYSDNYTESNNFPNASGSPKQQLRQYFPFSSAGINIGIYYTFGKKEK